MVVTAWLAGEPDHARPPPAIFRIVREVVSIVEVRVKNRDELVSELLNRFSSPNPR
jgi:hypothetical protein